MAKKRILVAALHWGLGHATRCIPIIRELEKHKFKVFIASDGAALLLLQQEFPHLKSFELPSYHIHYSLKGQHLQWKLLWNLPKIFKAVQAEKKQIKALVKKHRLDGIISDNRFGLFHPKIKSVFITHQLRVLTGKTTFVSSYVHQAIIRKFTECWVPDEAGTSNLSGRLGHWEKKRLKKLKYIGILSRFTKKPQSLRYKYLVLLSGPEPQRSLLEGILLKEFQHTRENVLFIRGLLNEDKAQHKNPCLQIKNYLLAQELEIALQQSEIIICRSGYSSIMDLAKLGKKAFFIPTPGQNEQEYLAKRFQQLGIAPFCKQQEFSVSKLGKIEGYSGFTNFGSSIRFDRLFALFQSE